MLKQQSKNALLFILQHVIETISISYATMTTTTNFLFDKVLVQAFTLHLCG